MNGAKLKIAVLYDVWEEESAEPAVEKRVRRKKGAKPRRKEAHAHA